ncbi:MAG: hypothetical protein ACJAYV_001447 [Oleispira sp.]|jgi:hypothetical protein
MSELLNTAPETRSILSASNTTKYKNSMNDIFGFKKSKIIILDMNDSVQIKLNNLLKNWQCNVQCFYYA